MSEKYLIVYFSRTGNSRKIAEHLQKELDADCEELKDKTKYNGIMGYIRGIAKSRAVTEIEQTKYNPEYYDEIVLISPVWAGTICPALRSYVIENKEKMKCVSLITTAMHSKCDGAKNELQTQYNITLKKAISFNKITEKSLKNLAI